MGFKPISELSTTNGGRVKRCQKWVLDDWSCNLGTLSAKLSSGLRNQCIAMFGRVEMWPASRPVESRLELQNYRTQVRLSSTCMPLPFLTISGLVVAVTFDLLTPFCLKLQTTHNRSNSITSSINVLWCCNVPKVGFDNRWSRHDCGLWSFNLKKSNQLIFNSSTAPNS